MTRLTSTYLLALTLLISIVLPTKALAHEYESLYTYVLGGDTCHVRNTTTKNAASLRKVDGMLKNISDDLTTMVSCPIPITYEDNHELNLYSADIEIFFLNSHSSEEQKFRCNVFSGSPWGEQRDWNSVDIPGHGPESDRIGSIEFSDLSRIVYTYIAPGRATITCGLPPKSTLISIVIEATIGSVCPTIGELC